MKIVLVNGSPNEKGCTYTALKEIEKILNENNVDTEIFWIGNKPLSGCIGCKACIKTGKCFIDDSVNVFLQKAEETDGYIFGSPVHFAATSGSISSFMDRVFFKRKHIFSNKLAASITTCRRAGGTSSLDEINKYFAISNMPIVSSSYWNIVYGNTPEEIKRDEEGMQTMRHLGHNMAWLLKCIDAGKKANIAFPKKENPITTNYIR